jgi:Domain of unknown function (DUF4268)
MILEKDFEDIISKYPELIEDGLTLTGRQLTIYGRRMDLLFEDRFKRNLIVELKIGPIKDKHLGQVLSYEGMLLSSEDPTIRVMLIGNRVPPNVQKSLDHHGIAWREITISRLNEFLTEKCETDFLSLLHYEESPIHTRPVSNSTSKKPVYKTTDEIISVLKSSEIYTSFKKILNQKLQNEEKAKEILIENIGNLTIENINEIIALVDEPYPYLKMGRIYKGPWFGRLLHSNTIHLINEDIFKINNWFNTLSNNNINVDRKIDLLLSEPYSIKGLNVGFITLMLYILDKNNSLIWFQGQHEGFRLIYPELEIYNGKSKQYIIYNGLAKKFTKQFNFDPVELDWIFSTGLPVIIEGFYDAKPIGNRLSPLSNLRNVQLEFWEGLKNYMEVNGSIVKMRIPRPKSWSDISLGKSDIYLAAGMNSKTNLLTIWLVIRGAQSKESFDKLYRMAYKNSLIEINRSIIWDRMDGRQRCAVILNQPADIYNKSDWKQQFDWFKKNLEKYVRFFKPKIINI